MSRAYQPKERLKNILLIVISSLFAIVGAGIWIATGHPIGPICVLFFGACVLAGVMDIVGTRTAKGQVIAIIGTFAFAVAFAVIVIAELAGVQITTRGYDTLMSIVSAVGVALFGSGSAVLLVKYLRRHG